MLLLFLYLLLNCSLTNVYFRYFLLNCSLTNVYIVCCLLLNCSLTNVYAVLTNVSIYFQNAANNFDRALDGMSKENEMLKAQVCSCTYLRNI